LGWRIFDRVSALLNADLNQENALATLNLVAVPQKTFRNALSVYEGPVCGPEVTQKTTGRVDLEQTMIAREKPIVR
jgi:hypothetical protein